ncbi:hypothetical protein C8J57DRAFT_1185195 [Mycena rebaudengoi]|nr:hypothetical protein C8J57DRAFT_1185195 [Mycena rebaudengoi]
MAIALDRAVAVAIVAVTTLNASRAVSQWLQNRELRLSLSHVRNHSYVGEDFPRQLPLSVGHAAMWFNQTNRYYLNSTSDWKSVLPPGNGWVKLGPENRPFSISMYHQMHCMIGIRHALYLSSVGYESEAVAARSHTNHCFNYLQQLLLCRADTTLKRTRVIKLPDGRVGAGASGNGVLHICRDWTQVRHFVEENVAQWPKEA